MNRFDNVPILGAIIGFFGSLTLNDLGVIVSILVAISSLIVTWIYKEKDLRLKAKELELKYKVKHEEK